MQKLSYAPQTGTTGTIPSKKKKFGEFPEILLDTPTPQTI